MAPDIINLGTVLYCMAKITHYGEELAAFARHLTTNPVVCIAGCGRGHSIVRLREHGVTAYGFDYSQDILDTCLADDTYTTQADLRDPNLVNKLTAAFDEHRFDLVVLECVLSLLTPDDVQAAVTHLREDDRVGHLLYRMHPPGALDEARHTIKSIPDWQDLCDPDGDDHWVLTHDQLQPPQE